jgi:hypothetical protein
VSGLESGGGPEVSEGHTIITALLPCMTGQCAPYRGADEGEREEEECVQHHVGGGETWGETSEGHTVEEGGISRGYKQRCYL